MIKHNFKETLKLVCEQVEACGEIFLCEDDERSPQEKVHIKTIIAALKAIEAAIDTIGYLLPLAKGYVAAHPGIRSTQAIIEDAESMIKGFRDE